ncbi:MAG: fucose isomerase [Planctomycetia bacterium]|nr:fucose isomerase [Planctomycetia bacterium]
MLNYRIKIGLVPERRYLPGPKRTGMFNSDYADANKEKAITFLKKTFADAETEFVDLDWLNDEGMLIETKDCVRVAEYLKAQNVDAIFIINCNFGNEEAAGKIAQLMNVPTLLWGPRDRIIEPNGTRYTDTQCGLFSISKQLRRYNVPFSYINNCDIDDLVFRDGVTRFLSVVTMVKNFRRLRILLVGTRLKPFKCVMANELELTERFGIDVVPCNLAETTHRLESLLTDRPEVLAEHVKYIKSQYDPNGIDDATLTRMAAFIEFYREAMRDNQCDVIATECWTAMNQAFGAMPCLAMSLLADMGCYVICESDIHGAITAALLACAARGKKPPFFGEFTVRHPVRDDAELLWHCGVFATSLRKPDTKRKLQIFKPDFCAKDGQYTIARFQGDRGKYFLLAGRFDTIDGPDTTGTYLWAKFNQFDQLERNLVEGPYIHHMSEIEGDYVETLREFAKYVPGLIYDPLEEM